jgi:hypothetical protein
MIDSVGGVKIEVSLMIDSVGGVKIEVSLMIDSVGGVKIEVSLISSGGDVLLFLQFFRLDFVFHLFFI